MIVNVILLLIVVGGLQVIGLVVVVVAAKVNGEVITSSPELIPNAIIAINNASVPLDTQIQ